MSVVTQDWTNSSVSIFVHSSCPASRPLPTQPAGKLSEGDQVVVVLVQQSECAVGHRVGVLVRAAGPRRQQPVQALELGPVQPVLALYVGVSGVTIAPRCRLRRCCSATVTPVQTDEVLRLEGEEVRRKRVGSEETAKKKKMIRIMKQLVSS